MAKRSPILGYNHNVRYRGLVFHVQTEDSGLQSPHLFTHLFKGGVIVATRKLVYDVGAVEDVIKNLMQAQHKAVLKELKRGGFDDKIDEYLGTTEGLLPRGAREESAPERPSASDISAPIELVDAPSAPIELVNPIVRPVPEAVHPPATATPAARTITANRSSAAPRPVVVQPPPPPPLDEPTLTDDAGAVAAAVAASTAAAAPNARPPTGRTTTPQATPPRTPTPVPMPARTATSSNSGVPRTPNARSATPPPIPSRTGTNSRPAIPGGDEFRVDSSPEIEISLGSEDAIRGRSPRDTAVEAAPESMGDPGSAPAYGRQNTDSSIPPLPPAPTRADRPASHGAATLPPLARPARSPSRHSAAPPTVMTRPVPTEDGRARRESEVIEVYAPAPPSAEAPPGERSERPGQYIVNRTKPGTNQSEAIPAGLGRPRKDHSTGPIVTFKSNATGGTQPLPKSKAPSGGMHPLPKSGPNPDNLTARPATPVAARPPATPPATPRTSSPGSSGVITTRPAVIVGAPQRPTPAPKVRKAREEEGRGFGQGLISEKSLDEVILAYLSEDAEDK